MARSSWFILLGGLVVECNLIPKQKKSDVAARLSLNFVNLSDYGLTNNFSLRTKVPSETRTT